MEIFAPLPLQLIAMVASCAMGSAVGFPFDVTIPNFINFGIGLMLFYSFLPFPIVVILLLAFLITRRVLLFLTICDGVFVFLINELVLKNILNQDRPATSCLHSKGMPSTHSALSSGILLWLVVETIFYKVDRSRIDVRREFTTKILVVLGFCALIFPIPFSRVVLGDHSWEQVGVGTLVGFITAGIFILACYYGIRPYLPHWLANSCLSRLKLKNDYRYSAIDDVELHSVADDADIESNKAQEPA